MKKTEICKYCGDDYIPKRRGIQKFCSDSCRSRNWQLKSDYRKPTGNLKTAEIDDSIELITAEVYNPPKNKIEKISAAGIGNAALGNLAADAATAIAKELFTPEKKKPVTKGDLDELKRMINTRFFPVINITSDFHGRKAYYDKETGQIVFYNAQLNRYELPITDL